MKDYNIQNLVKEIKSDSALVILYGAGTLGKLALYVLKALNIEVDYFCDSDGQKQGKFYDGVKIISPKELSELSPDAHIFLCNNYLTSIISQLEQLNFKNVYNCLELLGSTDFSKADLGIPPLNIKRQLAMHKSSCLKEDIASEVLYLKHIDIIVTERCSLRCRGCSNLMQYYTEPKNCDINLLFSSVDKLMECVGYLNEFRVIGGEPFMNNELYKIVNKLVTYENVGQVVIFTNATIPPQGDNLLCLKNDKVALEITNYGELSRNFDKIIKILKKNNISHITHDIGGTLWNDCASIKYQTRTEKEIIDMFMNCCVNDIISLLHGKLYRCPFSAHATNLKAIPFAGEDAIELADNTPIDILKRKIISFYKDKRFVSACYYCKGRAYDGDKVEPAVQAKHPLPLDNNFVG